MNSRIWFGPVNSNVHFEEWVCVVLYIKMNSRIWFGPVNSNFHFEEWVSVVLVRYCNCWPYITVRGFLEECAWFMFQLVIQSSPLIMKSIILKFIYHHQPTFRSGYIITQYEIWLKWKDIVSPKFHYE